VALQVYRYRHARPFTDAELQRLVWSGTVTTEWAGGPVYDIECDDSRVDDLDAVLTEVGFERFTNPGGTPVNEVRVADGTVLTLGAVADTEVLQRVGATLVGLAWVAPTTDDVVGTPSLRTLGTGAQQAYPGDEGAVDAANNAANAIDLAINTANIEGATWKDAVRLATTAALPTFTVAGNVLTATANGALSVDGVAVAVNDRILVKTQTSGLGGTAEYNGIYIVTATGSVGAPYVLTRTTDFDTSAKVGAGCFVFVRAGATNGGLAFQLSTLAAITLNTTLLSFQTATTRIRFQVFEASTTWTRPDGVIHGLWAFIRPGAGGGGSGGTGGGGTSAGGGGGGGGSGGTGGGGASFMKVHGIDLSQSGTYTITVGAGGTGGTSVAGSAADTNGSAGVAGNSGGFSEIIAPDTTTRWRACTAAGMVGGTGGGAGNGGNTSTTGGSGGAANSTTAAAYGLEGGAGRPTQVAGAGGAAGVGGGAASGSTRSTPLYIFRGTSADVLPAIASALGGAQSGGARGGGGAGSGGGNAGMGDEYNPFGVTTSSGGAGVSGGVGAAGNNAGNGVASVAGGNGGSGLGGRGGAGGSGSGGGGAASGTGGASGASGAGGNGSDGAIILVWLEGL